jgi:replicative DNA helicase
MEEIVRQELNPEEGVAGPILASDKDVDALYDRAAKVLKPEDFSVPRCRAIFRAAGELRAENRPIDFITLAEKTQGVVSREELLCLIQSSPSPDHIDDHIRMTKENARRRHLEEACMEIARHPDGDMQHQLSYLMDVATSLSLENPEEETLTSSQMMTELFVDMNDREENGLSPVLSTGLKALDEPLGGGLLPGSLYVLAGRPGVGKTTLALFLAEQLAQHGPVLYVSLEMTPRQLTAKRLARQTGIPAQRLLTSQGKGCFTQEEWDKVISGGSTLSNSQLLCTKVTGLTHEDVGRLARQTQDVKAVVVDHLGLLRSNGRYNGRTELVTEISQGLKQLAISLNVPIVALSQLNRASEMTPDKRPKLYQLRDSGSIEQDADVVMLLSRSDYEERKERKPWEPSQLKVEFAKNRFGANKEVYVNLYLAVDRVTDL